MDEFCEFLNAYMIGNDFTGKQHATAGNNKSVEMLSQTTLYPNGDFYNTSYGINDTGQGFLNNDDFSGDSFDFKRSDSLSGLRIWLKTCVMPALCGTGILGNLFNIIVVSYNALMPA